MSLGSAKNAPANSPRQLVSSVASSALIATSVLVLGGWLAGIDVLKSIRPDWPAMKGNTAACFLLAGVSLRLLRTPEPNERDRRLAQACAAVIGLVGLLTLGEDFCRVDLGLDQLLFAQSERAVEFPGRMSVATAVGFVLAAGSLIGLRAPARALAWSARLAALAVGLLGLLTAIAYWYGVRGLHSVHAFNTIAAHTTCLFLFLAMGTLCIDPERGPLAFLAGARLGSKTARSLLPVAIVTPLMVGWLRLLGQQAGFYGLEFGLALFAVANVVTFALLIWRAALWLNATDSQRRQAEDAALRLAAIVQSSEDAIIGKNLVGVVTSWNAGAERVFGYTANEMIGQPISQLIPADRQSEEAIILGQIRIGESVRHFETLRLTRAGKLIDISVTVSPIRDSSGTVVGASKVARDISERKRLDERLQASFAEIASLNATLETRVAARTNELQAANATLEQASGQLSKQKAALERSNGDLEQFAHVASHDLQEPLRGVAGCGQILQRRYQGKLDAQADELILHIVEGATRMQTLILDLLSFSRVGARGSDLKPVDSALALGEALSYLKAAINECGATVTADPLPTVKGDLVQLTQLFQNLVGNALKYRGPQAPVVHVGFRRNGSDCEFAISDNGIGIEAQYFERIFLIFQRLHTRAEYPGTGIGLALCKKIVERHGGRIWLESEAQRGSTFRFTISPGEALPTRSASKPRIRSADFDPSDGSQ